jgi:hypothetical protein
MPIKTKRKIKMRPQPPKWFSIDTDNCWFCNNRNHCGGCKILKSIIAKKRGKNYKEKGRR